MTPRHTKLPEDHPRIESLRVREKLVEGVESDVVALQGLIAHGRGEAFDYLIGETTTQSALEAIRGATAALLTAKQAVISVNGNAAALVPGAIIDLAKETRAKIEVNLFHRRGARELAIKKLLVEHGADEVLGIGRKASARIPELSSERRRADPRGILVADVVLIPLEDGDRAEALRRMGKFTIAIDLNPLSRTSLSASITIVDNIVRAMPLLVKHAKEMKGMSHGELKGIVESFSNQESLNRSIGHIREHLEGAAASSVLGKAPSLSSFPSASRGL